MSGWDVPTGSWGSGEAPEGPGSDDQGYQQGQPADSYRTVTSGEGFARAGRRGLPGYDQAQSYEQSAACDRPTSFGPGSSYGQQSGYGSASGYGQQPGYGPGTGARQAGYEPAAASAPTVRYRPDETAYGTAPQSPPPSATSEAAAGSGPPSDFGHDAGASGSYPTYGSAEGNRSAWSRAGDQQGYGTQAFGQHGYSDPGYGQQSGAGQDRGQGAFVGRSAYSQQAYSQQAYSQQDSGQHAYSQQDSGQQAYSQQDSGQHAYSQQDSGQHAYRQPGPGQFGYGSGAFSEPDQSYPGQDAQGYPTAPYLQQGFEPSGHAQGSYAQGSYAQTGYAQTGYAENGYAQGGYGQATSPSGTGYQDGYDTYGHHGQPGGYGRDTYDQGGYGPDAYAQPGFEHPGGDAYREDDVSGPALQPRPGHARSGQRASQRPSGIRTVLYLAAAILGVTLIVLLVIHLTKAGSTASSSGGSATPSTGGTAAGAAGSAVRYSLIVAAKVDGQYPLDAAAVKTFTATLTTESAHVVAGISAWGGGHATKTVKAIYDLVPAATTPASDFKAIAFVGYEGTFNPNAVIRYEKTQLLSWRMVNPGPHGGQMMCGYNTSHGPAASECVWVTTSTFGQVEFIVGQVTVKYPGASTLALEVRAAVEVPARS